MPWPEIFGALREINYQGPVVMEPFLLPAAMSAAIYLFFAISLGTEILTRKLLVQSNSSDPN